MATSNPYTSESNIRINGMFDNTDITASYFQAKLELKASYLIEEEGWEAKETWKRLQLAAFLVT